MKALTLWQPWASLVAMGEKEVETRCWKTKYRGELAIHAAAKIPLKFLGGSQYLPEFKKEITDVLMCRYDHIGSAIAKLPTASVLCVVRLVDVMPITDAVRFDLCIRERIFGNYEDGRYAWFFEMIERFETPIPAKGNRLLWEWKQ